MFRWLSTFFVRGLTRICAERCCFAWFDLLRLRSAQVAHHRSLNIFLVHEGRGGHDEMGFRWRLTFFVRRLTRICTESFCFAGAQLFFIHEGRGGREEMLFRWRLTFFLTTNYADLRGEGVVSLGSTYFDFAQHRTLTTGRSTLFIHEGHGGREEMGFRWRSNFFLSAD